MSDRQAIIHRKLIELIRHHSPTLIIDNSSTETISFIAEEWNVPVLRTEGRVWSPDGRLLSFYFNNKRGSDLMLSLGIRGLGSESTRQHLLDIAIDHQPPFIVPTEVARKRRLNPYWNYVYKHGFLGAGSYEGFSYEEMEQIDNHWQEFVENDLPSIREAIRIGMRL